MDGAFIWCRIAATLKRDAQGKLLRIVGTISDMDDNVRALRHLRYQAEHDPVTGYSNFAKFKTDAAELLATRGDRKYSLWYCDIRNFKFINDIYGYDIGDELLSYWAELIAEGARRERRSGVFPATTLPCCGAIGISTIWWRGSCAVRIC